MTNYQQPIIAVLLAAGGSTRMGRPKQLLPWRGQPMLVHSIAQLQASGCGVVVVVLGANAHEHQRVCESQTQLTAPGQPTILYGHHAAWADGQASSLKYGLKLARSITTGPFQTLVALCDQPFLTGSHYRLLVEAVREPRCRVAATRYSEGLGVPACFQYPCHVELSQLSGDSGAKAWLRSQPKADVVEFDFARDICDIDTLEEWSALSSSAKDAVRN